MSKPRNNPIKLVLATIVAPGLAQLMNGQILHAAVALSSILLSIPFAYWIGRFGFVFYALGVGVIVSLYVGTAVQAIRANGSETVKGYQPVHWS